MKRQLVIISLAFVVATPCFSQIIVGADKLNFYGVWNETMTADTMITDVPWDLVRDLGFTHGNYHIKRHPLYGAAGYPPLPAPAEMPSGFQLNAYLFRDYSSFSCHGSGSDGSAVNLGIKGLVVEYHPEFDGHYTRTDRGGNPCVGSGIRVAGAEKHPGDERIDGPLCWYVDGAETPAGGTVISTPRDYADEIGSSCNLIRHCSIRVRADLAGVLSNDIIFSHVVYNSSGIVRHRKDFRRDDLTGHGVDFFEVAFSGQLFSGIDNEIQIEWSGKGELYFDRVMYFNDCGWNILAGNLDNAIDSTITLADTTVNAASIGGFQIADEIVPVQYQTIGYVDDYIRTNTEYQTFYVTWPEWLHPEQPKYYRYMMERTTSPSFRVDLYPFGPSCPTDGNEFQDIIQYEPIDHYRKFQEANRDNGYHLDMHAIIQSYSLDVGGTPRYRYPSSHEWNVYPVVQSR